MGANARQVKGDERTGELAAKNQFEVAPIPAEIEDFANANPIYIYNVSPYPQIVEHPLVGRLTIPGCKPGREYSDPAIIKGMVPFGVREQIEYAEVRHESGRRVALDVLGIGPFLNPRFSLLSAGIFIAAEDTFDATDLVDVKVANKRNGEPVMMSLPRWVKTGKLGKKPTGDELRRAHAELAKTDFAQIAEADRFWDNGPGDKNEGVGNITAKHREALRRRGQTRDWDKPQVTMIDCPGCGDRISPSVVQHKCGAVLNWEKAIALGLKKAEDRPQKVA